MAGSTLETKTVMLDPNEIEAKILACHGNMKTSTISKKLGIKTAKVYSTLRKFGKSPKGKWAVPKNANGTFEPYGSNIPKKRSNHNERICKPYKTSQLR